MSPEERAQLEAEADRLRRRGEIAQALTAYRLLLDAFPDDEALQGKLALLSESLQPLELASPKANLGGAPAARTLEERAEACVLAGNLPEAVALYRQALAERPDSELLRDRLSEVFGMLRASGAVPASSPTPAPVRIPSRAAPAPEPGAARMPQNPVSLLEALLSRVSERRRS